MQPIVNNYKHLLGGIIELIESSKQRLAREINSTLTMTYWSIGKYLIEFEQKGNKRADYGVGLLKRLSEDLVSRFGKGFSVRSLERMRTLYLMFEKSSTVLTKLNWSHLLRLSSIRDSNERQFYALEASENNWSIRELDRQIFAKEYKLYLPKKSELKNLLNKYTNLVAKI